MTERFSLDFENKRFKNLKENSENQNTEKVPGPAGPKSRTSKPNFLPTQKQLDENKHMGLDD